MDSWIKPYAINQVCYCKESKEFVRITNGMCILDHSADSNFAETHKGAGCLYAPSEAIALRVVGATKSKDPIVAFTYRGVRAEDLAPASQDSMPSMGSFRRSRFIGRV